MIDMRIVNRVAIFMVAAAVSISSLPYQAEAKERNKELKPIASLLKLEEESYSADFSGLTATELSSVSLKRIFSEVEELNSVSGVAMSLDGGQSYKIVSPDKKVNLINVSKVEIILGNLSQLDAENNVKKVAKIDFNWINPTIYAVNDKGEKVQKAIDESGINDNLFDTEEKKYIYITTVTNKYDEKISLGFNIGGSPSGKVKFYEGYFTKEKIAKRAKDITSLLWGNSDYELNYGESRDITMITYDEDGDVIKCLPIELLVTATNDETEKFNISLSTNEGEDIVRSANLKKVGVSSFEANLELYKGYSKFDSYFLSISGRDNTVKSVYSGKYSSLEEAKQSGYPDLEELVTGDGYDGKYGNGEWFTIFSVNEEEENEVHQILVKTERGTRPREELSSSTDCEFLELLTDEDMNSIMIEGDSYQKGNFVTFIVEGGGSLSNIGLSFRTEGEAKVNEKESGREVVSGETTFDFSKGVVAFTVTSEDGENQADYFVRVIRKSTGSKLYVNTLTDGELMTSGNVTSTRKMVFSDYYTYSHDIVLANIGSEDISNLNVSLSSSELSLDEYWTLNGTGTLSALDDSLEDVKLAKVRIKANSDLSKGTKLTGTLTVTGSSGTLLVLNLNGVVGDAEITTKNLPKGTLYTLYNASVSGSSNVSGNISTFEVVRGSLPDGLEMSSDGSITGLPREKGSYSFTVRMNNSSKYLGFTEKEFTIHIIDNTNKNIAKESDKGYEITKKINTINVDSAKAKSYTMVSKGEFSEFKDVYLDGKLLIRDLEYTAKEGSTIITIFANILKEAIGRRTVSAIFENGKSGELKTAVLNIKVVSKKKNKEAAAKKAKKALLAKKKAAAEKKKKAALAKKRKAAEKKKKVLLAKKKAAEKKRRVLLAKKKAAEKKKKALLAKKKAAEKKKKALLAKKKAAEKKRKALLAKKKAEEKKRKELLAKKKSLLESNNGSEILNPNTELGVKEIEWSEADTKLYEATVDLEGYQRFKLEYRLGVEESEEAEEEETEESEELEDTQKRLAEALSITIMDKDFRTLDEGSFEKNHTFGNYYYKKGEPFYILLKKNGDDSEYENVFFTFETVEEDTAEIENNNSVKKANSMEDVITGSIHKAEGKYEDVDYFMYKVDKTGYLLLNLSELNGEIRISFSGKKKSFWSRNFSETTEESLLIPVKKGKYFVKVEGIDGSDPVLNYKIELENKKSNKYEIEINDTLKEASPMNRLAALDSKDDIDFFKTKIIKAGKYKLRVEFQDSEKPHNKIKAEIFVNEKKVGEKGGEKIEEILNLKKADTVTVVMKLKHKSNIGTPYKVTCKKVK